MTERTLPRAHTQDQANVPLDPDRSSSLYGRHQETECQHHEHPLHGEPALASDEHAPLTDSSRTHNLPWWKGESTLAGKVL